MSEIVVGYLAQGLGIAFALFALNETFGLTSLPHEIMADSARRRQGGIDTR